MTTESLNTFLNEDSYDLLDDLLNDEYDKFEEINGETNKYNGLNKPQKSPRKQIPREQEVNSSYRVTNKKEHVENNELDIEEGEILDNDSGPVEITSMFKGDKMMVKAFHENFHGRHLILKIYENCSLCPYCKLKLVK